jgi:ActR/RegA family two-component response regulator
MNNKENNISNIKNLLVVDDDQRIRDLPKRIFNQRGLYNIHCRIAQKMPAKK